MKTEAKFTFEKVRHDQENELHLVVSVKAPKTDWEKDRAPICVVPVIDVSSSMAGAPLDYAKKSAIKMVEHLSDKDFAGLVAFDSVVELISSPVRMTQENKDMLRSRIGDLYSRGCTNFEGGMSLGLSEVNKADLPSGVIKRIIMLTDGQANQGAATDYQGLSAILTKNCGDVTVSCFGYGEGADQELLASLAKDGKGNYAFIQNPDDALSAFAKELGGLLSTYAQNLEVVVEANNGHEIQSVLSDVDADGDDKKVTVKLPEILSEEAIHIVSKVKLSKQSKALPRAMTAFKVKVSYDLLDKDGGRETKTEDLVAKIKFVKAGKEDSKPDADLDKIVANAEIVRAQNESERLAKAGDFRGAQLHLQSVSGSLQGRGLDKYARYATSLSDKMMSGPAFAASASYRTSAKMAMTRAKGTSSVNAEVLEDASFLADDMDTNVQKELKRSFNDGEVKKVQQPLNPNSNLNIPPVKSPFTPPAVVSPFTPPAPDVKITTTDNTSDTSIKKSRKRW
jgi:Ca-activated chloride channel family protein